MNLRTVIKVEPSERKISHSTPVAFIGSCFASEIGSRMAEGKLNTLINPAGTVYNPASIAAIVDLILQDRMFGAGDLYNYRGRYLSLLHYTNFSSENPETLIDRINTNTRSSYDFLRKAGFLFITFGTARVYRFKETGEIVSNCHKLPSAMFTQELLSTDEITSVWMKLLDSLHEFNKDLKVIFTISPVRHWKDGAHANQVSKSVLFLAVENLLSHPASGGYFPAYEILMDDLRDYRYYADDMLHPSSAAIGYVWEAFSDCYLTPDAVALWKEARKITKAASHRFITDSKQSQIDFAAEILKQISSIETRAPWTDFSEEKKYFKQIISSI